MLNIYLADDITEQKLDKSIIGDVEEAFGKLRLTGTQEDREIIQRIESGRFNSATSFIDRFGYKLPISDLSSGSKAALLVANNPDKIIDLRESSLDARDIIIKTLKNGNIILYWNDVTILPDDIDVIDCRIGKYNFKTVSRLNDYLNDEWPYKPDLNNPGIEEI